MTTAPDRPFLDTIAHATSTPEEPQPWADLGLKPDEYQRIRDILGRRPTAAELAATAAANPFDDDKPSRVMAHFIAEEPVAAMLAEARDIAGERMALGPRSIIVSYGEGIGKTRLKLPAVKRGTARNMNSVAKMAVMLA